MRAHVLDSSHTIINTISVENLDFMPNLIDASLGGTIGDTYINGVFTHPVISSPPATAPDAAPIITASFNASLRRQAERLQQQGKSFEAVQLLLQAQGVKS